MTDPITAEVHGLRQSDWIATSGMHKSSAFRLIKAAGIQPEMRRLPGVNVPVAFLTPEQEQLLNALLAEYQSGTSLSQLEQQLAAIGDLRQQSATYGNSRQPMATVDNGSELTATDAGGLQQSATDGDQQQQSAIVGTGLQQSEIVAAGRQIIDQFIEQISLATGSGFKELVETLDLRLQQHSGQMNEVLVQLMQLMLEERKSTAPKPDPLEVARRLKEAAELAVPLSNEELSDLLGGDASTLQDGDLIRAGFIVRKTKQPVRLTHKSVWWTVIDTSRQQLAEVGDSGRQQSETVADHPQQMATHGDGWHQSATVVTGMGFGRGLLEARAIWGQVDVALPPAAKGPALPNW